MIMADFDRFWQIITDYDRLWQIMMTGKWQLTTDDDDDDRWLDLLVGTKKAGRPV